MDTSNNVIFDRCYFTSTEGTSVARAVLLGVVNGAVVDSWIEKITPSAAAFRDVQAISCFNKCGPLLIQNNYLQSSSASHCASSLSDASPHTHARTPQPKRSFLAAQ